MRRQILAAAEVTTSECSLVEASELASVTSIQISWRTTGYQTLRAHDFAGMAGLESLTISGEWLPHYYGVRSLPLGIFDDLVNLNRLSLYDNEIESLPAGIFDRLTKLVRAGSQTQPVDLARAGTVQRVESA